SPARFCRDRSEHWSLLQYEPVPPAPSGGLMAARHPVRNCPHGDASTPYPVRADEGWPLGVNDTLDAALGELSAALMACPSPLQAALEQLTPQDVRKGLSATPVAQRPA